MSSSNSHQTRMEESINSSASSSSSGGDSSAGVVGQTQTVVALASSSSSSRNGQQLQLLPPEEEEQQQHRNHHPPPPRGSREMKPKEMLRASRVRRPVDVLPPSAIVQDTTSSGSGGSDGDDGGGADDDPLLLQEEEEEEEHRQQQHQRLDDDHHHSCDDDDDDDDDEIRSSSSSTTELLLLHRKNNSTTALRQQQQSAKATTEKATTTTTAPPLLLPNGVCAAAAAAAAEESNNNNNSHRSSSLVVVVKGTARSGSGGATETETETAAAAPTTSHNTGSSSSCKGGIAAAAAAASASASATEEPPSKPLPSDEDPRVGGSRDSAAADAVLDSLRNGGVQPQPRRQQEPVASSLVESLEIYTGPVGADFDAAAALQRKDNFVAAVGVRATSDGGGAAAAAAAQKPLWSREDDDGDNSKQQASAVLLRPWKRKFFDDTTESFVDPATIAYLPDAWSLDDDESGNLRKRRRPCGMIHSTAAKLVHPDATRDDWRVEKSLVPLSAAAMKRSTFHHMQPSSSASAAARAQRSRHKLLGGVPQKEKEKIHVGSEHQVLVGDYCPCAAPSGGSSNSNNRADLGGGPDQVWDPQRAQEARLRGEKIDEFLEKGEEFNVTMLLMQALHSSDYRVKAAMKEFIHLYNDDPNISVALNESQSTKFHDLCRSDLIGKEKNFKQAAERLGVRKESFIVNYYNWKKTHRTEYKVQKDARRQANQYCEICDDGGTLLVCDHCHKAFHLECLTPPLEAVPKHDWYCDTCIARSPAKLRRLSYPHGTLTTQSPGGRLSSGRSSVARRLHAGGTPTAALKAIFKDVKSQNGNAVRRPSGMDWDPTTGHWVRRQGAEEAEPSEQPSPADNESDGEELAAADDDDDVLEENDSDEDEFEANTAKKKRAPSPPSSVSTTYDNDSDFKEEDIEDEDDDDEYVEEVSQAPRARPPSPVTARELYGIVTPITPEGLLLTVIKVPKGAAFGGYRPSRTGVHVWTSKNSKFRSVGDLFFEIDGVRCEGKSFAEITALLKKKRVGQTVKTLVMSHKVEKHGGKKSSVAAKLPPSSKNGPPSPQQLLLLRQRQQQQQQHHYQQQGTRASTGGMQQAAFTTAAAAAVPNKPMGMSLPQHQVFPVTQTFNGGSTWLQSSQNMGGPVVHSNTQQLAALRPATIQPQRPDAFVPSAGSNAGLQIYPIVNPTYQNTSSLVDRDVLELLQFLAKRGITNPRTFLNMDVDALAVDYAAEKGIDQQAALDFVCHARLYVRAHYQA